MANRDKVYFSKRVGRNAKVSVRQRVRGGTNSSLRSSFGRAKEINLKNNTDGNSRIRLSVNGRFRLKADTSKGTKIRISSLK